MDYRARGWATHDWTVSQFARMLPSSRTPRMAVRDYFADTVRDSNTTIALPSVAAQRLCAWNPAEGRDACRDAMKRAGTPHARRVPALSALGVGERKATVREWLDTDKENHTTLRMLDDRSFIGPKVSAYFAEKIYEPADRVEVDDDTQHLRTPLVGRVPHSQVARSRSCPRRSASLL